ncbi:MAG: phosphotriesterase [Cyclobacteriaceae bacterium]|nr:phosphotriesterase [Cyclobacteriaceae bacterium]MDH4297205.1 phosphotriesterase [Cyclobacteriaceae bacterium]MDH5249664.1 phosphotriesterase [Cyclobacteriaceae bacterium]
MATRRSFIQRILLALTSVLTGSTLAAKNAANKIMTVKGFIDGGALGNTLIHEHILVDFIGAAQYNRNRWNQTDVIQKVLPYLKEVKEAGCSTLVDCTPNYLGRDVQLLQQLSTRADLNILTNTGYYGGSDIKFLPEHAFRETASALADRWTAEWEGGIDGTTVKPGFIKISVNPDRLSAISQKLVLASAKTHLKTGLTIASHTGPAVAALEEIEILKREGVAPDAFIWVHAQNENDWSQYQLAARSGSWVSLDGLRDTNVPQYIEMLTYMKKEHLLHRTLISHDAGWYEPGKPDGGNLRGFTTLFRKLIPALEEGGFSKLDIHQLIRQNPVEAFTIRVRKWTGG